jgi:hypothetical protein
MEAEELRIQQCFLIPNSLCWDRDKYRERRVFNSSSMSDAKSSFSFVMLA